jgi:TonB-linked SusC/RagA family outer membrane protein
MHFRNKLLLVMKLSVFLLLLALQISAKGLSQQIFISVEHAPLSRVLRSVVRQAGVSLIYNEVLLKNTHPVTLHVRKASVRQALDACLKGQPLTYTIEGDHILIQSQAKQSNHSSLQKDTTIIIHGAVTSDQQKPLAGVTILVKGTTNGAISDANGHFTINADPKDTLVFRSLGYQDRHIVVDNRQTINMQLQPTSSQLNQLVVVGYGTQKNATVTGAVEQVSSKTFQSRAVTNIGLALQGETPGLVVTRSSPRPGNEGLTFRIRGASSVNGNDPLIIVDGVPVLNYYSFQNLNPDDIASISVLKDASAAIYGSRAANGVILVTTKKGKKGKVKVDYNGSFRFNTNGITSYSPSMQQYATMWIEANKEETTPNWWVWQTKANMLKMQQGVQGLYNLGGWQQDFPIFNANRIDEMFARRFSYQHNLSISGGSDKSDYRLSFGYANNQGDLATAYDGQKQYNARFKYDYNLSDKLKVQTNISLIDAYTSSPSVGLDNTLYAFDMPFYPAKNPFGEWLACFNGIDGGAIRNAAAMTSDGGRDNKNSLTGRIDLRATYQITKDLSIEGLASLQNERYNREKWVLPVPLYNWYGQQTGIGLHTGGNNNIYYTDAYSGVYQYYSALLHYKKTLNGKHHISAVAGLNAEKETTQSLSGQRVGFTDLGVQDLSLAQTTTETNGSGKSLTGRYSYLARVNYNYKEKYLAELLGRRDGSSRFAKGYKFKNFGGASVGWVFTKEDFLNGITSIVNFGKIRASYGVTGNEASGLGAFDYLSTINIGQTILGNPAAPQNSTGLNNNGLISYTRTWERVRQKDIGVDLEFLNNHLSATFDYFVKDNVGMLTDVRYPSVLGGSAPKTNSGRFNTKGWETVISWKSSGKDFNFNVSVNMSNTHTLITGVQGADSYGAGENGIVNGYPYHSWFVYKTDGYFKDQKEVDAYYAKYGGVGDLAKLPQNNAAVALRPGDTKKVDVAGTDTITAVGNTRSSLVYAGDGDPHYTFGINLGGSWKGFDFTVFLQGQLKQNIMRTGYMAFPFGAGYTNQNPNFLGKTWTMEHSDAIFPRLTVNSVRAKWNYINNDFMLQNNMYMRLKSLILGYTLPKSLTQKVHLDRVRVYFSGNDLWEAVTIKDGFDPEMGETSQNSGYPFARTWSFGINIGF